MDHEGEIMAEAKKAAKTKTEDTKEKQIKHADVIAEAVPVEAPPEVKVEIEKDAPAKAGKRSTKALRETEEKEVKEARKAEAKTDDTPKIVNRPNWSTDRRFIA
jgi:flagellar basal body rod protein FlgF